MDRKLILLIHYGEFRLRVLLQILTALSCCRYLVEIWNMLTSELFWSPSQYWSLSSSYSVALKPLVVLIQESSGRAYLYCTVFFHPLDFPLSKLYYFLWHQEQRPISVPSRASKADFGICVFLDNFYGVSLMAR